MKFHNIGKVGTTPISVEPLFSTLGTDGDWSLHAQRDMRVTEWNPMLGNLAKVTSQFIGFVLGLDAEEHFVDQRFPIVSFHAPGQETDQIVVLFVREVVC